MKSKTLGYTTIEVDPGDTVLCDLCNGNFTNSDREGGFLFQSKAVCPNCSDDFEKKAEGYNEQHFIGDRCPEGKSFADWVRDDLRRKS